MGKRNSLRNCELNLPVQDLNMYATFGDDRLRGLGMATGQIYSFPIDLSLSYGPYYCASV